MSQIAQQDNLVIESKLTIATLEADIKAKLVDCIKFGTITDALLKTTEAAGKVNTSKILAYLVDKSTPATPKYSIIVINATAATPAATLVALN